MKLLNNHNFINFVILIIHQHFKRHALSVVLAIFELGYSIARPIIRKE